jgi:DNA-binding NarL/FixJ family response regulator
MQNGDRPLELLLVEDHAGFRNSLETLLNAQAGFICASVDSATAALPAMELRLPQIVIMDINLPDQSGIECTRAIKDRWPQVQVLICTVHEDDDKIFGALKAGATGYILKRAPIKELVAAIGEVQAGGSPMSASIARKVVSSFRDLGPAGGKGDLLTQREQEILDQLAQGLRFKEIAERLFVSLNTVRTHVRHIYEKLQVQSRIEALNKMRGGRF